MAGFYRQAQFHITTPNINVTNEVTPNFFRHPVNRRHLILANPTVVKHIGWSNKRTEKCLIILSFQMFCQSIKILREQFFREFSLFKQFHAIIINIFLVLQSYKKQMYSCKLSTYSWDNDSFLPNFDIHSTNLSRSITTFQYFPFPLPKQYYSSYHRLKHVSI